MSARDNLPADDAPLGELLEWARDLRAKLDRDNRIEALAKEAALRVFAAAHPHGAGDRARAFAVMAIDAGEAFALAWEARKQRR